MYSMLLKPEMCTCVVALIHVISRDQKLFSQADKASAVRAKEEEMSQLQAHFDQLLKQKEVSRFLHYVVWLVVIKF